MNDHARPYHGPYLIPTPQEVQRISEALRDADDPVALAIKKKIEVAQGTDERLRQPSP